MFKASRFWKSILSVKDDFFPWIRYRVRDGHRVRFWHDEWCGQSAFLTLFPNLYLLDRRQQAVVADNFLITSGQVVWDFNFHRDMTDREVVDFTRMLALLDNVYVNGGCDVRVWKPAVKGNFSVKSFYDALLDSSHSIQGGKRFWDSTIPPQVLAFYWVARSHKILSLDKLRRRKHINVNGCPMCLKDEESVYHLLIHRVFAHKVWSAILNLFDMQFVMPLTEADLFHQWGLGSKYDHMRILWKLVLYAVCWKIWLARNNRVPRIRVTRWRILLHLLFGWFQSGCI